MPPARTARKPKNPGKKGSKGTKAGSQKKPKRVSHRRKPDDMDLHGWQRTLRRQAGETADFTLRNLDTERFFGDFAVGNPEKGTAYRVSIRGTEPGGNYCTCPDYATNTLGTCKHLEFALATLRKRRGAKTAFARGWRPAFSELYLHYGEVPELYLSLGTEAPARLASGVRLRCDAAGRILTPDRVPALVKSAARRGHELRFYDDAREHLARRHDDDRRRASLRKAYPKGERDARLRTVLPGAKLLPYQRRGAWFIAATGRCLLADDMGLGKTVQAIAGLRLLRRHGGVRRALVVCPASLKQQWADEIARFAKEETHIVAGPREDRARQWAQDQPDTRIVNYEVLDRDLDEIRAWEPEVLILDEAQRIKNWATLAARAVRGIDAPHVAVLTGTPLENHIEELHALVEVVDRHRLGPLFAFRHRHAVLDETGGRVVGYRDLDRIGETLRPILLRRTRDEVLKELPKRTVTTLHVPMTEAQRVFHAEDEAELARLVAKWKRYHFLSERDQLRLRVCLQRMRMVSDSTYLLDPAQDEGTKVDELRVLLKRLLDDPARKVVVFSTWLKMHELIIAMLNEEEMGYAFLSGSVPSGQRGALIKRFREDDACRVFLSTDAGGTGLNLQCADTVIDVDLPWNPAVLEQRAGRVHRMGQARPVRIFRLVSEHGIERNIERLLGFKRSVFAGVLDGGAAEVALDGNRLKRFLEDVEKVSEGLDEDVPAATRDAAQHAEEAMADLAKAEPSGGGGQGVSPDGTPVDGRKAPPAVSAAEGARPASAADAMARSFAAGAAVLNELAKLAQVAADPRHRRTDPETGRPCLMLPLDDDGTLAGLGRVLASFGVTGGTEEV